MKEMKHTKSYLLLCFLSFLFLSVACSKEPSKIEVTGVSVSPSSLSLTEGETSQLSVSVSPSDATDKVEWSSSDETIATVKDGEVTAVSEGEATITAKAGDKTATCSVKVENKVPEGAVDLGLSVYWAECNLGAEKPEDYGDYYAWGEVEPYYSSQDPLTWKEGKTGYNWASYKWCNGNEYKLTKYCPTDETSYWDGEGSPDNKKVLDPEDDAAYVILGVKWRMPTDFEWSELREKCTWTMTTQNGVKGRLVTGPNGNSIFLPAAGNRGHTGPNGTGSIGVGSIGYYWSSFLTTGRPNRAWYVHFNSSKVYRDISSRYNGYSIRPVTE